MRRRSAFPAILQFLLNRGHRLAVFEQTRYCNRRCPACRVPLDYDPATEISLAESLAIVDRLYAWGYRALSYMGGEATAEIATAESVPIWEHSLAVIRHAARLGMVVNLTSNGDFLSEGKIVALREAGLTLLTLSLHSYSRASLDRLVELQGYAARSRIVPVISTVFTQERAKHIPAIARHVVSSGIMFGVGICQTHGGAFSSGPDSLVPSVEVQRDVFSALLALKPSGLIRTNRRYLREAPGFYRNNWNCDASRDSFVHVGVGGTLDVCSEVRTSKKVLEVASLASEDWRRTKADLVARCSNCLHQCHFETQRTDPLGDVPTAVVGGLILAGGYKVVARIGKRAARRVLMSHRRTDWKLNLTPGNDRRAHRVANAGPAAAQAMVVS